MKVHNKFIKAFSIMLIAVMLFAAMPLNSVSADAATAGPGMIAAGDRLVAVQNDDGGWDWPGPDVPSNPTNTSPTNTIGPIAKGLAQAYNYTEDADYLDALEDAGDLLLTKTTFATSDGYLAAQLDDIFGVTTYTSYVITNFYDKLAAGTYARGSVNYTTQSYITFLRNDRSGRSANLAAWDVGMGLVSAASCGVTGAELQYWIDGVKAEINELDDYDDTSETMWYFTDGLAGALYGLAFVDEDMNPDAGYFATAEDIGDLFDGLLALQNGSGGFVWHPDPAFFIMNDQNEGTQATAYAILALNEYDRAGYLTQILAAADYMLGIQLATGGWDNYPAVGSYAASGENNEVTAEALWGVHTAYPLDELWVCETGACGHPGAQFDTIQGAIDAVAVGGTIHVAAGTYAENPATTTAMNKSIKLIGETDGSGNPLTILEGTLSLDNSLMTEDNLIENIKFQQVSATDSLVLTQINGITIKNCEFVGSDNSLIEGRAIQINGGANGTDDVVVENCLFRDGYYIGIQGAVEDITVKDSEFVNLKSGLNMTSGETDLVVDNTDFSVVAQGAGNDTYGIRLGSSTLGSSKQLAITDSSFVVDKNGFVADAGTYHAAVIIRAGVDGTTSTINNSSILGAVVNLSTHVTLDSTSNWWGSAAGPAEGQLHPDSVGDILVCPWLLTESATTGEYRVTNTDTAEQFCYIQDAIDAASNGDTIEVGPGTYVEDVVVTDKYFTLIGEVDVNGDPISILQGSMSIDNPSFTTEFTTIENMYFDATDSHLLTLKNLNGGLIKNCTFDGNDQFMTLPSINGINLTSGPNGNDNITVEDSLFKDGLYASIGGYANGITVKNSEFTNVKSGINHQGGGGNLVVQDSYFKNKPVSDGDSYGIRYTAGNTAADSMTVTGSTFEIDLSGGFTPASGDYHTSIYTRGSGSDVLTVEDNTILGGAVNTSTTTTLDASPNYWGSPCAPIDIVGDVVYSPWYVDDTMGPTTDVEAVSGTYTFPTTMSTVEMNAIIACAEPKTNFIFDGVYDIDGIIVPEGSDELTFTLADDTILNSSGYCFNILGDYTKILGETHAGAKCVPSGGWFGIGVNYQPDPWDSELIDLIIDGIEIDGTGETTGAGIWVAYNVTDLQILNSFIHDLGAESILFEDVVYGVLDIQGNMFKDNGGGIADLACPEEPFNAEYNSWGVYDVTSEIANAGICPVDYTPWTHVEVFIESTNPDVDNWSRQVFVGEQITYEVTADLRQVMGADFVLEFPTTNLSVASHTVGSVFDENIVTITGNEIHFEGWQKQTTVGEVTYPAVPVADGQGYVLFTVTFNAVSTGRDLSLNFDETTDNFSMSPGYGPSLHIYADELVDTTLDVIDRPTLAIDGLEGPFYTGVMSQEITNTICNPTTGGDWSESPDEADAIGWIRISNVTLADIASLQFLYDGVWNDFSVQDQYDGTAVYQDGADVVARFGNYNFGFDIPLEDPQWCDIDKFRVTFINPGTHDVSVSIYDMMDTPYDYNDDILLVETESVTITVETGAFDGVGTISMQGRTERLGVPVILLSDWYADATFYSTNTISDNLKVTSSGGLYTFTTNQPRYLNVTAGLEKFIWVDGTSPYELAALELKGGNAKWVDDNTIDLDDASIVGANYGMIPGDQDYNENADVNFDGKVNIQDLALVGGNYDLTSEVAYAAWSPQADETVPGLDGVSPAEGPVVLGTDPFVWIVDASDAGDNLYELEIDHSMQGSIPEFSVYANEGNPYGTLAEKTEFEFNGVYVTYIAADQMWIINFGDAITDAFVANGGITFYVVLKDRNGNQFGSMYVTTPENTFVYTITR